ncbi:myosin regulatory light chain 11 isoform X1 [Gorilla gorilla gorilla]|uniref:myosin regulatory light chain 11 isoform X1 n=1 Tax=Gorilla gorilla gorilla TaxID=9595 RepID=UPI0008F53FD7
MLPRLVLNSWPQAILPPQLPKVLGLQAPKRAKRRTVEGGSSSVFSMFDQTQIQEFKELAESQHLILLGMLRLGHGGPNPPHHGPPQAFTVIDQNRDGIIDKEDLRDTFAAMGRLNVKNEELDAMMKEASGPINFTVFLTMFGEKLKGADPEDVITGAFKVLDPEGKGTIKKKFLEELLTTQCDRFSQEEIKNMWAAFPPDVGGNVDYKNICYVITHGDAKDQE